MNIDVFKRLPSKGLHLFPVIANGKTPAMPDWQKLASDNWKSLAWIHKGKYNVGVFTGKLGGHAYLIAVDLDRKNGKDGVAAIAMLYPELPRTFTVKTPSGGEHRYFRTKKKVAPNAGKLGPGIDIRSQGSYVVAPGSSTPDGEYVILDDAPIADAPAWLEDVCNEARPKAENRAPLVDLDLDANVNRAIELLLRRAPSIEGSGGDHHAFVTACMVRDVGVSEFCCLELMAEHWNERCSPPWSYEELAVKVANAYAYAAGPIGSKAADDGVNDWAESAANLEKATFEPGKIMDMSKLAGRPVPVRQWLVPNFIPKGKVVLLTGDGGLGKSLLVQQLLTAVATGKTFLGYEMPQGPVFGLFCEDDEEELWRRQANINANLGIDFEALYPMSVLSGVGQDLTLMTFSGSDGSGKLTPTFEGILDALRKRNPVLVVIDTLADTFGGNEIIRNQVRAFINGCLGRLALEIGCTVILLGHPSQSGRASGEGISGSTAWNNSVRARLYLERPAEDDADPDERILTNKKQNYGPSTGELRIRWQAGAFQLVESRFAPTIETSAEIADKAYLDALAELEDRREWVSPAKNQATYAPKVMVRMPECRGQKLATLEAAQERLFRARIIKIETSGRKSHEKRRIAFSDPNFVENLKNQIPKVVENANSNCNIS